MRQGQALASVESNESLQVYTTASPLAGVITERLTNPGEQAEAAPLFTVADLSTVWVELSLFPRDRARVKLGQDVRVQATDGGLSGDGQIVFVSPLGTGATQTITARVLLDTGRPREALERVERAMAIEPLSAEGLRLLGRSRYELKQVPEAIDAYQRAIVLDERDVWALNNLGLIYIQQDRSEAAVPVLARAVELRSDSPVFQNNLGTALERTGHYAAAKKAYESALAADSTYGKASASLARVTPLAAGDSATVDLSTFVTEFHAELERWQDVGQAVDTTVVDTAQAVE